MNPRWSAADPARHLRRCHANATEKGTQRNLDSLAETRDPAFLVQGNNLRSSIGKIVGQETEAGSKAIVCVRNCEPNGQNSNLEDITGRRAFNVNGAGQDMGAGTFVGHFPKNVSKRLLDLFGRQASSLQDRGGATCGQRLDFNSIAGLNAA